MLWTPSSASALSFWWDMVISVFQLGTAFRAEAAVIAWMRHQTTDYDHMHIARIKGERRSVRRELAGDSREILEIYRKGLPVPENCPLAKALK